MRAKPFLKWPGGKYRSLKHILPTLAPGDRLVEPFLGSGAVFLNASYKKYLLCDKNPDLIAVFTRLQKYGESFVAQCKKLFTEKTNAAETFYSLRKAFNASNNADDKAVLFVYLNRHSFNGLVRYNARREYNAPFGRYKKPYFPERELRGFSKKLDEREVTFAAQNFESTFANLLPGDVVYCDPPYVPLSASSNFTSYAGNAFTIDDQRRLAFLAQNAAKRGVPVFISNHDTPGVRTMYAAAKITNFQAPRTISCAGDGRRAVPELVAAF